MKQRTDMYFRKAAPRNTRYELPDRDDLVLEVQPSGKHTWRYRYRLNGKREKVTLALSGHFARQGEARVVFAGRLVAA